MKSDYEILGLPENASKELVEQKYGALLRQYKNRTDEHGVMEEDAKYYETITAAYNRIMGYDPTNFDDNPTSVIPYPVRRFWGKVCTLAEQHRLVIVTAIVLVVLGVIIVMQMRTNTEYDINIKFIGSFNTLNTVEFSKDVAEKSDTVETAAVSFYTITTESGVTPNNMSLATQFQSQLIYGQLEIIFMDEEGFNAYKREKAFYRLDDLLKTEPFAGKTDSSDWISYETEYDKEGLPKGPESGIYAIDITDTAFFDDMDLEWLYDEENGQKKSLYVAIAGTTKNLETAQNFLAEVINY